jgi:STE24 endopeptidase
MLGTTRISLNDNLLTRCTPEEIEAVMAHELGHYVLGHGVKMLLVFSWLLLLGFAFVHVAFSRALARWGSKWQIRGIGDIAGLPLFAALFAIYFAVMGPVVASVTRSSETEADQFSLSVARQPDGFATVALKLAEYRKLDPARWEEMLFYDHPSGRSRVAMAMRWKAENLPKP